MLEVMRQRAKERADPVTRDPARARHLAYHAEQARQMAAGLQTGESRGGRLGSRLGRVPPRRGPAPAGGSACVEESLEQVAQFPMAVSA